MDLLFYRYRHLTVLLVAIVAQLGLLAYQVRNDQDVRLIRVWSVTAVTPLARLLDSVRGGGSSFIEDYVLLLGARQENKRLKAERDALSLDVQRMRADLDTAERAQALALFQKQTPLETVTARVIMNTTGASSSVFVDVGSPQGIRKGMAVITPDGIVGKIIAVYPTASMVLLMNDPQFAAGVVSQKNKVQGTLKGQGGQGSYQAPIVDYVQNEQTVEQGEWFFTSGNDFIFPRGLKVGTAVVAKNGRQRKDIQIKPSGFDGSIPEEVLVVVRGVHGAIPELPTPQEPVALQMPPADTPDAAQSAARTGPLSTDADRVLDNLRAKSAPKADAKSAERP